MTMLKTFLQNELNLCQLNSLWFQQDGATAHSTWISIAVLMEMFSGRIISRFRDINWPAHSPHLSAPDYFLWATHQKQGVRDTSCQY
jgi:hypothetical protein